MRERREVYSLAIVLQEEGIYSRCRIYGTDIGESVARAAKIGIFPLSSMKDYTANYIRSGGKEDFSKYYSADAAGAVFRSSLRENVVFAQHNLEVQETIAPERLLVFEVKQGWEPLCAFLGVPVPDDEPFPHVNDTVQYQDEEHWSHLPAS